MTYADCNPIKTRRRRARLTAAVTALLAFTLGLVAASPASAAYEQVGSFAGTPGVLQLESGTQQEVSARWPEEVQLGNVAGMAVNYTGAGGVPRGTLYVATAAPVATIGSGERVARYNPDGSFSEAWTFAGSPPSERCGPDGDLTHPVCVSRPGAPAGNLIDVDIDQGTGDVYVYDGEDTKAGENEIHVYSPDGSKLLAEFGERAVEHEATAVSPGKLHRIGGNIGGGIAVNGSGDVYIFDENSLDNEYHRLMEFEPLSADDYEHYIYAGQGHDIAAGFSKETLQPTQPVADSAGDLYVVSREQMIFKLDPGQPLAPPLCEFKSPKGGIVSIAVDPVSGEVFFSSGKPGEHETIHQLGAGCNAEGKFVEKSAIHFSPARSDIGGLVFDPGREFAAGRPLGVLYAGASNGIGGKTEGKGTETHVESSLGYVFSRPFAVSPVVAAESVGHVTATTAELSAGVNPEGSATRYVFEYETEAEYLANASTERFAGAVEAPVGGASVGEGNEAVVLAASLGGLEPDTTYRFRVLASSHCSVEDLERVCEGAGEAQAFRSFPIEVPGLPDHRVYELVSPAQKHGGGVFPADPAIASCGLSECKPGRLFSHFPMQSAPGGDAVVYEGTPFESEAGQVHGDEYIARRDPSAGWKSVNLTPTQLGLSARGFTAFGAELGRGVLLQQEGSALSPEAPAEYNNVYSQATGDPFALTALVAATPPHRVPSGSGEFEVRYGGESADGSRIFFAANDALTAETPSAPEALDGGAAEFNLYEWHEGHLALVNVLPGNVTTQAGAVFGASSAHAISGDGSRVFWSSEETGHVYARIDGRETLEVPGPATCKQSEPESQRACFLAASADGARVLLANGQILELNEAGSAYEPTVDLTAVAGHHEGGFQGILGQGEDLSHLYFVDTAVLSGEEENNNCQEVGGKEVCEKAEAGKDNLYAWSQDSGTRFIARLQDTDNGHENGGNGAAGGGVSDWATLPSNRTAQASPQGRYLAFLSQARLTGYDNTGPCAEESGTSTFLQTPCPEAFIYDSATGKLVCASCNPSGVRPLGWTVLRLIYTASNLPQPRYLTDEGRLFFDSEDSLVPADTNGKVEDVYEYEPSGVGTCEREGGCVSLISAGTGVSDSNFLTMDEGGANVFFTTRDRLSLRDKDELIDLYDAREGGGIASETEVARSECQGETCQPPVSPLDDTTPASSVFSGPGDLVPALPGVVAPKKKTAVQTRAQKLAGALKACHRLGKTKRKRCEATARKRYGSKTKAKSMKSSKKGGK